MSSAVGGSWENVPAGRPSQQPRQKHQLAFLTTPRRVHWARLHPLQLPTWRRSPSKVKPGPARPPAAPPVRPRVRAFEVQLP